MQSQNNNFMQSDVALYGMFVSVALVFSYIEALIPTPFTVPGIKLGLANIVIIWILYSMGVKPAIIVNIFRVLLAGLLFGNMYSILFSAVGAALSLLVMIFMKKNKYFTIVGVSVAGGVVHNIGQIAVSMFVLENARLVYYLPFLLISGVVSGVVIGVLGGILYKRIKLVEKGNLGKEE